MSGVQWAALAALALVVIFALSAWADHASRRIVDRAIDRPLPDGPTS